jgi:hypothetical protein
VLDGAPVDALMNGVAGHAQGVGCFHHTQTLYRHIFRHVVIPP